MVRVKINLDFAVQLAGFTLLSRQYGWTSNPTPGDTKMLPGWSKEG